MQKKRENDNYQVRLAEEAERRMDVCLNSRLMFCHRPLRFLLSVADNEGSYLSLMCYKHNPPLWRPLCRARAAGTDLQDLLQWLLLRVALTTMVVMRRDTQGTASPLNDTRSLNVPPPNKQNSRLTKGLSKTCHD